jgi:hypothetical protein
MVIAPFPVRRAANICNGWAVSKTFAAQAKVHFRIEPACKRWTGSLPPGSGVLEMI